MRDIKYRQYLPHARRFHYWGYIENNQHVFTTPCSKNDSPYLGEQYTGLKDKNDVEIYEGDILRCWQDETNAPDHWRKLTHTVSYNEERSMYVTGGSPLDVGAHRNKMVIGNIHENKELLNVPRSSENEE